jgi:hypothetical protein
MDRVGVEQEGVATMFAATEARQQALLPSSVNTELHYHLRTFLKV